MENKEIKTSYSVHVEFCGCYDRPFETRVKAEEHFFEIKNKGGFAEIWEGMYFPKTRITRYFLVNSTDFARSNGTF